MGLARGYNEMVASHNALGRLYGVFYSERIMRQEKMSIGTQIVRSINVSVFLFLLLPQFRHMGLLRANGLSTY